MKERRLTLDTNILFYAMDRDAGERHRLAMEIVDKLPNDLSGNPGRSRDCLETLEFEMSVKRKNAIYLSTLHQNKREAYNSCNNLWGGRTRANDKREGCLTGATI